MSIKSTTSRQSTGAKLRDEELETVVGGNDMLAAASSSYDDLDAPVLTTSSS